VIAAAPVRVIVTGKVGSGKTQTCAEATARLRDLGWGVAGVLSLGVWAGDEKVAIDALDVRSGDMQRLAEHTNENHCTQGPATPGWRFHAETIAWCNSLLSAAADCDLLVVDELGPLEFESGEGLIQGMRALDDGRFRLGLVVVRPRLIHPAQARWPTAAVLTLRGPAETPSAVDRLLAIAVGLKPLIREADTM
jgi:nucleoside-triphosphatase